MLMTSPFSVQSGMSTSQRCWVWLCRWPCLTMSVEFGRRLPFTASDASVMQCMPAPGSPSHMFWRWQLPLPASTA
eukprot:3363100-Pleurochrysis_carterae.AAC.1